MLQLQVFGLLQYGSITHDFLHSLPLCKTSFMKYILNALIWNIVLMLEEKKTVAILT